jgi:hypothetical protein
VRAQIGIEFFLLLAVVLAFIMLFYSISVTETERTRVLESAVLSKRLLDSLSMRVDFAFLAGNGSVFEFKGFVPKGGNCFYFDAGSQRLYCALSSLEVPNVADSIFVFGPELKSPVSVYCDGPIERGWISNIKIVNNGSEVFIEC